MKRISFITGMVVISVASGLLYLNTTRDEKKPLQDTHSVVKRDEKELDVKYGNGDPKAPSSILSNVSEPQKSRLKEQQLEQSCLVKQVV